MARRRQTIADDIIELTANMPWWVGLLLALISYVILHRIAGQGLPQASGQDVFAAAKGGMVFAFASLGQYALPGLFGIGALVSIISRLKRTKLHSDVTSGLRGIGDISWKQFEELIGEHFRRSGYQVEETGPGADGGVDLVLRKAGAKYFVQCKHWKAYKVGIKPIRELLGVMVGSGASGGYVVTSGEFTADAIQFAQENRIELIAGKELRRILENKPVAFIDVGGANKPDFSVTPRSPAPQGNMICPKCGSQMVLRVARKGDQAGQKFWGCSRFPAYRSTLSV